MFEQGITIAELAEELDVTKRTIRYHLTQIDGGKTKGPNGVIIITPEEQEALTLRIKGKVIQETMAEEIDVKNDRIQKLHEAITYLNQQVELRTQENQQLNLSSQRLEDLLAEKEAQIKQAQDQINFLQKQLQTQTQILNQEQQLHLHTKQELDQTKSQKLLLEEDLAQKKTSWFARLFS